MTLYYIHDYIIYTITLYTLMTLHNYINDYIHHSTLHCIITLICVLCICPALIKAICIFSFFFLFFCPQKKKKKSYLKTTYLTAKLSLNNSQPLRQPLLSLPIPHFQSEIYFSFNTVIQQGQIAAGWHF